MNDLGIHSTIHPSSLTLTLLLYARNHFHRDQRRGAGRDCAAGRARFASGLGFSETELAEMDIVVQEIGTNAARMRPVAGGFTIRRRSGADPGLELFYWDTGPGIYDLDRAIRDGVSTSGSLGAGLGAIRRLMDEFDVYSTVRTTARRSARAAAPHLSRDGAARRASGSRKANEEHAAPRQRRGQRFGVWSRPHPGEDGQWRRLLHQASAAIERCSRW